MNKLLEKWEKFSGTRDVYTHNELIDIVSSDPGLDIRIDSPRGSEKKFGGLEPMKLPFDYGEWPKLVNPADDMGWDLIIVPSAAKTDKNMVPIGYIQYKDNDSIWNRVGKAKPKGVRHNTKIIIAPNKQYNGQDKKIIENFFGKLIQFEAVVWI
tara:strand:- start:3473 stop:3934 length:462 start_codon:yes stop_codon:yes gene_type:complete